MKRRTRIGFVVKTALATILTISATFPEPNRVSDDSWWFWPFVASLWVFLSVDVLKPAAQK